MNFYIYFCCQFPFMLTKGFPKDPLISIEEDRGDVSALETSLISMFAIMFMTAQVLRSHVGVLSSRGWYSRHTIATTLTMTRARTTEPSLMCHSYTIDISNQGIDE